MNFANKLLQEAFEHHKAGQWAVIQKPGAIAGLKKLKFNNTDFGTIVLSGYAPQP